MIFGGTIASAKFTGVFTDSVIAAGVLPRQGAAAGANNIPTDNWAFSGHAGDNNMDNIDSAEAGGMAASCIKSLVFSKPVVSSDAANGIFSIAIAADGVINTTDHVITKRVLSNPVGTPDVLSITRISPTEIRVVFDKPMDTASFNHDTVQVSNGLGTSYLTFTLSYFETGRRGWNRPGRPPDHGLPGVWAHHNQRPPGVLHRRHHYPRPLAITSASAAPSSTSTRMASGPATPMPLRLLRPILTRPDPRQHPGTSKAFAHRSEGLFLLFVFFAKEGAGWAQERMQTQVPGA